MQLTSKGILASQAASREAGKKLRVAIYQAVIRCKHKHLAECEYTEYNPPLAVCLNCGLSEEGWGCGYQVLHGLKARIPQDDLYGLQTVRITDDDKTLLVRRQATVKDIIRKKFSL